MIDLKEAKEAFEQSHEDMGISELGEELCQELADAREIIEELSGNYYEKVLNYHRHLKEQQKEAKKEGEYVGTGKDVYINLGFTPNRVGIKPKGR